MYLDIEIRTESPSKGPFTELGALEADNCIREKE